MGLPIWLRRFMGERVLVTRKELGRVDAATLLRRSRAVATSVYVGDDTVLCRVMGRYRMYVASDDDGFGAHVMLDGAWESWLTVFMARRIRPGMCIVDAGANHGYYTLMFAHLAGPSGRVAAIEPHPRTAALLRRSVAVNGFQSRVTIFERAAGATDDAALFIHTPANEPKNSHVVTWQGPAELGALPVIGGRLDTLLVDWPRVDFIKIDVEGNEEALLEGAWPLIVSDRPTMVLEYNAARCFDPMTLLTRLTSIYGSIRQIHAGGLSAPLAILDIVDATDTRDRMLFLEAAAR